MSIIRVKWWSERLYTTPQSREPFVAFAEYLKRYIAPSSVVLDLGAGAGELNSYQLRGRCSRLIGVDVDPRVSQNPLLDHGVVGSAYDLPFADGYFDVVFSAYVLEHVDQPARFAAEVKRVLKPGGLFLAVTPNRFHYVALMARMLPVSFSRWFNKRRGRDEDDSFPTFYYMNTRGRLRQLFEGHGFAVDDLETIEVQPNYLTFSLPTYLAGVVYERTVNSSGVFAALRVNIIGAFRKRPTSR
jgi:SAM-dependent methyltransferase